jgi:hypothetical protein
LKAKTLTYIFLVLSLVSFFLISSCGKKEGSKTETKTETGETGEFSADKPFHVVYDVKGNVAGTLDAIYSQKKSRITSNMDMKGQKISSTTYTDGQMVYMISEIGGMKMGTKMDVKKYSEQSGKKEGQYDISSFRERLKDYDKVGTEEILGKKCDIYQSKDGKLKMSIYKEALPLKFDFGTMTFIATKIETDVKVSDDTFNPPQDVKYVEMDEMFKDVGKTKEGIKNLEEKTKELEDAMKKYNK